jgi:hypothetical protein
VLGVAVAGLTERVKVHVPASPLVSLSPPLTVWVPGASEVAALIAPVEVTTTSGECAELIPVQLTVPAAFVTVSWPL